MRGIENTYSMVITNGMNYTHAVSNAQKKLEERKMERTEYRIYKATNDIMMKNARFNGRHITPKSMQEIENCMFDDMEYLYDEIVGLFNTLEEAKTELAKHRSDAVEVYWSVPYYDVRIYFIEEVVITTDEDGDVEDEEFVGCMGVAEWQRDIFAESNEEE